MSPQPLSDPCPPPAVQPRQTLHRPAFGVSVLVVMVVVVVSVRVRVRVVVSVVLVVVPLGLLVLLVLPVLLLLRIYSAFFFGLQRMSASLGWNSSGCSQFCPATAVRGCFEALPHPTARAEWGNSELGTPARRCHCSMWRRLGIQSGQQATRSFFYVFPMTRRGSTKGQPKPQE